MSFPYKNPISSVQLSDSNSVLLTDIFGTNFSILQTGGYMEVWSLQDLNFSTFGGTQTIRNSGNTIPINFYVRPVVTLSDRVVLNSDGISSGRRRLGMLVYVNETNTTYQYTIDDYETLWDAALSANCITSSSTVYTIFNRVGGIEKPEGQALIDAWTGSTIEGQSGTTREDARWKIYYGSQIFITGGTYDSGTTTLNLFNSSGGTIQVSGFSTDNNTTVTGGTYDAETGDLTLNNSDDTSVTITGITNVYVTGGTLSGGTLDLTNSTGGTVNITGFTLLEYVKYDETLNLDSGSRLIDSQSLDDYSMLQYNYVLGDGVNYRSGTFTVTSDRNNIAYSEIATQSVGFTKDVVLSAITNNGNIEFRGYFPSNDWQINFVRTSVPVIDLGPIPSLTPTPTPTSSPLPSPTPTPSVTATLTPTPSITPTLTPTPTNTPTSTITPTPSVTPTNTVTPTQSITPSSSVTPTPTLTPDATPTPTPSITPSITPSVTPSITPSVTNTMTPTVTPSLSVSATLTPTPSVTATLTPTPSVTATLTPTPSVTPTNTVTPTITPTPSATVLEYELAVATPYVGSVEVSWIDPYGTPTSVFLTQPSVGGYTFCALAGQFTLPAEITLAKSPVPCSFFPTPTPTNTPTSTLTPTPSITPSLSLSANVTPTPSITPSLSVSATVTPTPSITPSLSVSATVTPTPTPSPVIPLLTVSNSNPTVSLMNVKFSGVTEPLESGSYPINIGQSGFSLTHDAVSGVGGDVLTYEVNALEGETFTGIVSKNGIPVDTFGPTIETYPYTRIITTEFLSGDVIDVQIS